MDVIEQSDDGIARDGIGRRRIDASVYQEVSHLDYLFEEFVLTRPRSVLLDEPPGKLAEADACIRA